MCVEKNVFEFNESGLLPQGCHEITFGGYVCFKKMQLKFDWKKGHKTNPEEYEKEPIIFFEYTGKQSEYLSDEDFISNDKYKGKDYDDTEKMRDKVMKK